MKQKHLMLTLFVAFSIFSCDKESTSTSSYLDQESTSKSTYSEIELEILDLVNSHRESIGQPVLVMNQFIYEEAAEHSESMASSGVLSHDGFSERAESIWNNVGSGAIAENVAYNYPTAEAVVSGWLSSNGHRTNIEGDYTLTGIAVRQDKSGSNYYTQIFLNY